MSMKERFKNLLICAISSDNHYVKEPITLTQCGHSVCRRCLFKDANIEITCNKCGVVTCRDLKNDKQSSIANAMLKLCFSYFYRELEKEMSEEIKKFKEVLHQRNETIELHFKFVEEEIELRMESIKNQLEQIFKNFKNELNTIKEEIIKCHDMNSQIEPYDISLKELKNDIEKNSTNNEKNFYKYQNNLIYLKQLFKNINEINYELNIKLSNTKINEDLIGQINYKNYRKRFSHDDIVNTIRNSNYEIIELNAHPYDMLVLPNNHLIVVNTHSIHVYNEKLNRINIIHCIDNKSITPIGIAVNAKNQLYITDQDSHSIIMVNTNFEKLKSFGSRGTENDNLNYPHGICCKNGYVYVCDYINQRIQILSLDLEYLDTFKLDYKPVTIQISERTICINGTYFYDLNTKSLKLRHDGEWMRISEINSYFYTFSYRTKKAYFYNADGLLLEEIVIDRLDNLIVNQWDGFVLSFYKNLIMTSYRKGIIIKFLEANN